MKIALADVYLVSCKIAAYAYSISSCEKDQRRYWAAMKKGFFIKSGRLV